MKKRVCLVIIGPQGSGKGTQAKILAEKFHLVYFSMGETLKKVRDQDTNLGKKVRAFYDKGVLVPEKTVEKIILDQLKQKNLQQGIVFEGYPRTLYQEKIFRKILKKFKLPLPMVIYLKINLKTILKRIAQRKLCGKCSLAFRPKDRGYQKNICPKCHGKLSIRPDDKPKAIAKRLKIFVTLTKPTINYYRKNGLLLEINGEPSIEVVAKNIIERLNKLGY